MGKKGPAFERDTCKALSLWWTNNEDDDVFYRTSGSGGRATARRKLGKKTPNEYGDIGFKRVMGKPFVSVFLCELKRGYTADISVLDFIDSLKGRKAPLLQQWWNKAEGERTDAERKYTLIIFRRDRHRACIMISLECYNELTDLCLKFSGTFISIDQNYVIIRLEEFMQWVDRATVELMANQQNGG